MPISHVDLNGGRLRTRRDSRQLRLSDRHLQNLNGDTLIQAGGETVSSIDSVDDNLDSTQAPQYETSGAAIQPNFGGADSRLCNLKAVFSGPCSTAEPPTQCPTDDSLNDSVKIPTIVARPSIDSRTIAVAIKLQPLENESQSRAADNSGQAGNLDLQTGQSRLDLITGEWTWFAATRAQRPNQYASHPAAPTVELDCPFCAGKEDRTPNPVWMAKLDDVSASHAVATSVAGHQSDSWSVRVVPNLYPAVTRWEDTGVQAPPTVEAANRPENEGMPVSARMHRSHTAFTSYQHAQTAHPALGSRDRGSSASKLFPSDAARGGHEVIIEAPRHTESLGELNTAEVSLVFAAYAERVRYWRGVPGVQHVSIFKNVGRDAGASIQHSHSQLIATNRVPGLVQHVTRRLQAHHARMGSCLQCDLVRAEVEQKSRVVSQTDSFVAYCPFASRFPMQIRLTSKEHLTCFSDLRARPLAELARLTLRVVRWLEALRPGTSYNLLIHTCPVAFNGATESQHWAMDIFPRMSRMAGFELSTGAMINSIYPEAAAKAYRAQARLSDPRYVLS